MTPNCIIFDIDGTLADLRHRLHWIKGPHKNYDAFYDAMCNDEPIMATGLLARELAICGSFTVVLVSGRPDSHRDVTSYWFREEFDLHCPLYMRKAGDYRPDDVVKREILAQMRADGFEPLLVIDDRPRVVEMWRSEGVFCLQCPWHEDETEKYDVPNSALSLMIGPSGAGKTKWLQYYRDKLKTGSILSSDEMRYDISNRLVSEHYDPSINDRVFASLRELVKTRLKLGLRSVIDATNLHRRDRLAFVNLIPKTNTVEYLVIDRPLEDKLRDRGWRSEELIMKHHQTFQSGLKHILAGDDQPNVRVFDLRNKV